MDRNDGYTSVPWLPYADDEPAESSTEAEMERIAAAAREARSFNRGVVVGALVVVVTLALCALIL